MGNQQSHNQQNIQQYTEEIMRNSFNNECTANTNCSQMITTGNVHIDASGNCTVEYSNNCTVFNENECNMNNTIDTLFTELKDSGNNQLIDHIGTLLEETGDGFNSQTIHSTNITDVRNSFTNRCNVTFGGYQQIAVGDFVARCDGNASIVFSNNIENNSRCVAEMINTLPSNGTPSSMSTSSNSNSTPTPTPTLTLTQEALLPLYIIGGIVILLTLIRLMKSSS